jgi:sulfur relay (sulfurtransferase) complex TusBCD TusD component (DsrE family)
MKLLFVMCVTPLESEYSYLIPHLASKAKAKGHDVTLYLYGEGSYCAIKEQRPERLPSVSRLIESVSADGVRVCVGGLCAKARGVSQEFISESINLDKLMLPGGYLTPLFEEIEKAEKVIFIG